MITHERFPAAERKPGTSELGYRASNIANLLVRPVEPEFHESDS